MTTSIPKAEGRPVRQISVDISYNIIEHFSKGLYRTPHKAIEELVTNGYDAWANNVWVHILTNHIVVIDDGDSMTPDQLQQLWWIADSPKTSANRMLVRKTPDGKTEVRRPVIGKFGIGKLASFAIGRTLTHLCRIDDAYYFVSVDTTRLPKLREDGNTPYEAQVLELSETSAREYAESVIRERSEALEVFWRKPTWTFAVIGHLIEPERIKSGRLRWLLGNGMPIRDGIDTFQVWVDGQEVQPKLEKNCFKEWTFEDQSLQQSLRKRWDAARTAGQTSGTLTFKEIPQPESASTKSGASAGPNSATTVAAVLPNLGEVTATIRLFDRSLKGTAADNVARSYGFFVRVRGRLINPEDGLFHLKPPSYGTYYSSQFIIDADGLDASLLADRERIDESAIAREFQQLQHFLYLEARDAIQEHHKETDATAATRSILPLSNRTLFREPLNALARKSGHQDEITISTKDPIKHASLESQNKLAGIMGGDLVINKGHPFIMEALERIPDEKKYREARRLLEVLAITDGLLEGFMETIGVDNGRLQDVMAWRDQMFKAVAFRWPAAKDDLIQRLEDASTDGDEEFEKAIADVFRAIGFDAKHYGSSGQADVLVVAPVGKESFTFIIDAKGSKGAIRNDQAELDIAGAHRKQYEAEHAFVVAREFAGFKRDSGKEPMLIKQAKEVGKVSILTVEAIEALYNVAEEFPYPLRTFYDVLTPLERPSEKLKRIEGLKNLDPAFDWRGALDIIWDIQRESPRSTNRPAPLSVAVTELMRKRGDWIELGEEGLLNRLVALEHFSRGLLQVTNKTHVVLLRAPDSVAEVIRKAV